MPRRALCVVLLAAAAACAPEAPPSLPVHGTVLVVLDTLSAAHVSAYGYDRETTPNLDRLAGEGVLFEHAISNASWTLPGLAGLLSGTFPGARNFEHTLKASLVEELQSAGIATAAFTEGGYASSFYGVSRGFDAWTEEEGAVKLFVKGLPLHQEHAGSAERTFSGARQWLREHAGERFFLLVHTYETHTPYERRSYAALLFDQGIGETLDQRDVHDIRRGRLRVTPPVLRYVRALYDGGVHESDRHLGELLGTLDELGRRDDTLVVVTSDHGEELEGRIPNWTADHGHALYDEIVRVPLVFRDPAAGWPPQRVAAQVRTIDVLPTILDRMGVPAPPGLEGRTLIPLLDGSDTGHRDAFATVIEKRYEPKRRALRDGTHKLIVSDPEFRPKRAEIELYDLIQDPAEATNLADREPDLRDAMRARLEALTERVEASGIPDYRDSEEVPDQLRERLESLGYAE